MRLKTLFTVSALVLVFLPVSVFAATVSPADTINWLALFFACTTFYSELLAAIPAIKSNAIYQQVGRVLNLLVRVLRSH
jgi:uncharacterized protein YccT (UPF0319 family)